LPRRHRPPLVALEQASVTLGGRAVLRQVTLALHAGARLGVLGANGSGKSTLLRVLRGDQWLDPHAPGQRTFALGGAPTSSPIGARAWLGLCTPEEQDAYVRRELDLPVEAVIRSGLDAALYPAEGATPARAARVRAAAEAMGVTALLGRSFLSLSRGEGRKVLVARALAPGPAALLLDEVCDGLDAPARAALLARLAAVSARGTAVVTAVHRAEELFPGVEQLVWLVDGRIAAAGARDEVVARWKAAFQEEPGGTSPTARPRRRLARHPIPTPPPTIRSTRLFDLRRVTVLVEGQAVLRDVTWRIERGEAWAVTGPNGAGKSTLLRLLSGEEQPARGTVHRLDLGRHAGASALRLRLGLVSPELQARHRFDASGEALVLSGFQGTVGLDAPATPAQRARVRLLLAQLGLARLARRAILSCSYGEVRLLLLARALAPDPEVLLLDEPLAGLDPGARRALGAAVAAVVRGGTGLVLVTHHEDEIPALVQRRARLEAGRLTVTS
jgi:molybdate transport system ATP-binding protein